MYRAFRLEEFDWNPKWSARGHEIYNVINDAIEECLEAFISDGEINGTLLQNIWFPPAEAQVFISHSHLDRERALSLAGWLSEKLGIFAFVDSCVWGHSDDLLRKIDDAFCWQVRSKTYNYALRNRSTSHVHMMLASALSQMIDAAECVIFVSSPNAVNVENAVSKIHSPWIYYELGMMEVIRTRTPAEHRGTIKEAAETPLTEFSAKLPIYYEANFDSLTAITDKTLDDWAAQWSAQEKSRPTPLDLLYQLAPFEPTTTL